MSLIYKCDFYNTTTDDDTHYPQKREITISGNQINGVDVDLILALKLEIPAAGGQKIHASFPAWKDAAQILKDWLDATFP